MTVKEAFELYMEKANISGSSKNTYKPKIESYIKRMQYEDVSHAINEEFIKNFVFSEELNCKGRYDALNSFYKFIEEEINKKTKKFIIFPIDAKEVEEIDNARKADNNIGVQRERTFISRDISLTHLFDDEYYKHLHNDAASATVKSAIALAISAGYDTGEMFPQDKGKKQKKPVMKMEDCIINEDYVQVKNYSDRTTVPHIYISGECAEYIKQYYEVRKSFKANTKSNESLFFLRMYKPKEVGFIDKVGNKPYSIQEMVLYMLKYISQQLMLPTHLSITDLRYNMVLHYLYQSRGSALQEIIEVFGFPPFVQMAFDHYCEEINRNIYYGYNPFTKDSDSFFSQSSPDDKENEGNNNDIGLNNPTGEEYETRQQIVDKRVRDSNKVKKLKERYNHACQICGIPLTLIDEVNYSEVNHIQPLGKEHNGVDNYPNMIVLCPNHHTLFDLGIITLNPEDLKTILHIDENNELHEQELKLIKHELSATCIRYHFENIFLPLKQKLRKSIDKSI